jgi:cell shape-determining protein MreD
MGDASMNSLNVIALVLAAYLAVYFQACQNVLPDLCGAQIDLLPPLMVYCALNTGLAVFTIVAILGGLWFDAFSANPLGITILPLFLIALVIHWNRELILRDQRYAQFILGCLASALVPLLTVLLLFGGGHKPLIGWGSLWQWLVMVLVGGAFSPVFFWLFDRLNRAFNYQRLPESSFRQDREIKRGRS